MSAALVPPVVVTDVQYGSPDVEVDQPLNPDEKSPLVTILACPDDMDTAPMTAAHISRPAPRFTTRPRASATPRCINIPHSLSVFAGRRSAHQVGCLGMQRTCHLDKLLLMN